MEPLGGRAVDYVNVILESEQFNIQLGLWPVVYPWPYNNNLCLYVILFIYEEAQLDWLGNSLNVQHNYVIL